MKKTYETSGYFYDDGDVPTCHFCQLSIESLQDEFELHDTCYSGVHCCTRPRCAVELVRMGDTFEITNVEE